MFISLIYAAMGKYDSAIENLKKLTEMYPSNVMVTYYLGAIYLEKGEIEKATEYFKKTVEQKPNFDIAYFNLGLISEIQSKYKEAEEYYNKALAANPQNLQAMERLAQLYFKNKEIDKAIEQYKKNKHTNSY